MGGDELTGLGVHALDVVLQLCRLDPPLASATYLDGRKLTGPDQGVSLGRGDVEDLGDLGELKEPLRGHAGVCPRFE